MKVSVHPETATVNPMDMRVGQIAMIVYTPPEMSFYIGQHVLRTYDRCVLLEDPKRVWTHMANFTVRVLEPNTKVNLTVEL